MIYYTTFYNWWYKYEPVYKQEWLPATASVELKIKFMI